MLGVPEPHFPLTAVLFVTSLPIIFIHSQFIFHCLRYDWKSFNYVILYHLPSLHFWLENWHHLQFISMNQLLIITLLYWMKMCICLHFSFSFFFLSFWWNPNLTVCHRFTKCIRGVEGGGQSHKLEAQAALLQYGDINYETLAAF